VKMKYCPVKTCKQHGFAWSGDKFCNTCGAVLSSRESNKCPDCNADHFEHHKFCPKCGYSFTPGVLCSPNQK